MRVNQMSDVNYGVSYRDARAFSFKRWISQSGFERATPELAEKIWKVFAPIQPRDEPLRAISRDV